MGMFDTVIIERLYCYFCGAEMVNHDWQTKSGAQIMSKYESLDEFWTDNYQVALGRFAGECPKCGRGVHVLLWNESERYAEFHADEVVTMQKRYREEVTTEHPNHLATGFSSDGATFQNWWCTTCEEKGYEPGEANPEMDSDYVKEANESAIARWNVFRKAMDGLVEDDE